MFFRHKKKPKKGAWFVPVRGSYLPASPQGWALYLPYTLYLVASLIWVAGKSGTIMEAVFGIIPYWVAGLVIMQWIASRKS